MRPFFIIVFSIVICSCETTNRERLLGKWQCYRQVNYSMVIDTAVNRQIFEFRTNGIYKNSEFNLTGHGNWTASMDKNILEMVSYQGFANEYKILELNESELVLQSKVIISQDTLKSEFYFHRLDDRPSR